MIYFIQEPTEGLIKIGFSKRISERLATIERERWAKVELLATMAGDPKDERRVHKQFAADRVRGEWFRPSADLMRRIDALRADPAYGWRWCIEAGRPLPEDDSLPAALVRKWREELGLPKAEAARWMNTSLRDYDDMEREDMPSGAWYWRHRMSATRAWFEA